MAAQRDPGPGFVIDVQAAVDGCAADGQQWPDDVRLLAVKVVAALMEAGLPVYSRQDGDAATGVQLALDGVGHNVRLMVLWRQHPRAESGMPGDPWRTQQDALHHALRTILLARGFRLHDDENTAAPVVAGAGPS